MFRLLTYTYLILVNFKRHFSTLIPPHPPHDQQGREVVVCCEAAVSYLACLFADLLAYLLTYLLACLLAWFVSWLIGWLDACLLAYLLG